MANPVRNMDFEPDDRENELYSTRQIGSVPLRLQDPSFCINAIDWSIQYEEEGGEMYFWLTTK